MRIGSPVTLGANTFTGAQVISATGTALQLSATSPTLQLGSTQNLQISYDGTTTDAATYRLNRNGAGSDHIFRNAGSVMFRVQAIAASSYSARLGEAIAVPAGGTAGVGYTFSSTSNFGVFFGSGAPTLAAAQGSIYMRSDGSSTSTRAYVNTDGGTTWTAVTTAA